MKESVFVLKSVALKAIANAKRLEILYYLKQEKEISVGKLEQLVHLSQSALSQHLAILRKAKIVKTRRNAQTIYYSLDSKIAEEILKMLEL